MSVSVEPSTTPHVENVVTKLGPQRNPHRLMRIFRKATGHLPQRPFHGPPPTQVLLNGAIMKYTRDERMILCGLGVSREKVYDLVKDLSPEDIEMAMRGESPMSEAQKLAARRAARFGVSNDDDISSGANAEDSAKMESRAARFTTEQDKAARESEEKRLARFGVSPSTTVNTPAPSVGLSDEARAQMEAAFEARARRFGA